MWYELRIEVERRARRLLLIHISVIVRTHSYIDTIVQRTNSTKLTIPAYMRVRGMIIIANSRRENQNSVVNLYNIHILKVDHKLIASQSSLESHNCAVGLAVKAVDSFCCGVESRIEQLCDSKKKKKKIYNMFIIFFTLDTDECY